jgi:hypothetical protein
MKPTFLIGLWAAFAAAPAMPAPPAGDGQAVDLVEFGRVKAWPAGEGGQAVPRSSTGAWKAVSEQASPERANVGIEWDEPREFREVRFSSNPPIPESSFSVEYWVSAWPAAKGGGWTLVDTPWKGEWRAIRSQVKSEDGAWRIRFAPLSADENKNAGKQPSYTPTFRRAIKIRLRFRMPKAPEITRFEVVGLSRWDSREVLVQAGCEGKRAIPITTAIYNGRIEASEGRDDRTHLRIRYLEHLPGSTDATILSLHTPDLSFGVALNDVIRNKGIYVADAGIFIGDSAAGMTFNDWIAAGNVRPGLDILSQVAKHDEQSLERAMGDIPTLSMTGRSGRHSNRYIPVGMFANREKYGIEYNGNLFVSKHGSKLFPEEVAHMAWSGDELAYRFGAGENPDFREREHAARQHVLEDDLPAVVTEWSADGVEYREEAFSTVVGTPLDFWKIRGDEVSALMVRLTVRNASEVHKRGSVWLDVSPHEQLELRGTNLFATADTTGTYASPRLRSVIRASTGDLKVTNLPLQFGTASSAVQWHADLAPDSSQDLYFTFTFRTLTDERSWQPIAELNYEKERSRVIEFWKAAINQGMRLEVPDEILNRFHRSVLQHILLSVYRDVPTGLYMAPCGTYDYNIFANETDMQVRLLDMRGLHQMAAKFVEPLVALQGSKPFPGNFHDGTAILHGARVDENHDYTHSGYNLNHGWTLWTLAEHYLFTRDENWLRSRFPHIRKAAEWIVSERKATMKTDADGNRVWEYGLLPAGQLEDNEEWQYWFAVNAYAYRGLRAAADAIIEVDPQESAHLRNEAERYRQDLRAAVFRSMAASPVAPLRDGTWVPAIGTRTHAHGRDVGWIRNILYGPHVLIDCGVISPDEPAANWILRDLEDNLFMSGESFSVSEQDWFSRGGITLQPNLVNTAVTYLERDEIPAALRAFYNAFAVSFYPDVNAFTEWEPSFGRSGGPFFKTSDEAGFLAWLRLLLVRESGDTLYLASGAPGRWFRHGDRISLDGAATFFGPVDLHIESHVADGFIEAAVRIPERFRGKEIKLRLRHPEGRPISRVETDGAPSTRSAAGWITVSATPGLKRIRAYF